MKKRMVCGLTAASLLALTMAGCSNGNGTASFDISFKPLAKDEKAKIKVLFYSEQAFSMLYGTAFSAKFPNIEVETIPLMPLMTSGTATKEDFDKLIAEEKPDVMLLSQEQYQYLAGSGRLLALEPIIHKDNFDLAGMHQPILEQLKLKGSGSLYGLAPTFNTQALFYNKDLFDRYGVSYPTNQMTWDEVLQLAKRFPKNGAGDQRIYGYVPSGNGFQTGYAGGYYEVFNHIAATQGLQMVSEDNKLKLNTEPMKNILKTVVDAYQSGAIAPLEQAKPDPNKPEAYLLQNPFLAGKAAMTVGNYMLVNSLEQIKKNLNTPISWQVVTEPVDPNNRDYASGFTLSQIWSIRSDSENQGAAWEFVKYVNSDAFARSQSKVGFELQPRSAYSKEKDGHSLEAFYQLKPDGRNSMDLSGIPLRFFMSFNAMANKEIAAVIEKNKSVDEALKIMEEKGQQELIQAQNEKKSTPKTTP